MKHLIIRKAKLKDIKDINRFLRFMVEDMEKSGGPEALKKEKDWVKLEEIIKERIEKENKLYLITEFSEPINIPVGFAEASITKPGPVFEQKKILHIHCLFVIDTYRGRGIGKKLLDKLLKWGKNNGCLEAELNVLTENLARNLYKSSGFNEFQIKMTKKL